MVGLSSSLRRRPESRSGDWIPASAGMTTLGCTQTELVSVFSFVLLQLPAGDYVDSYVQRQIDEGFGGNQRRAGNTNQQELALRKHYGLDQPCTSSTSSGLGGCCEATLGRLSSIGCPSGP